MYDVLRRLAQLANTLDEEGLGEEASALDQAIIGLGDHMTETETSPEEQAEVSAVSDQVSELIDATVNRLIAEGHSMEELASTDLLSNELTTVLQEAQAGIRG
jgi:hypothetical protein